MFAVVVDVDVAVGVVVMVVSAARTVMAAAAMMMRNMNRLFTFVHAKHFIGEFDYTSMYSMGARPSIAIYICTTIKYSYNSYNSGFNQPFGFHI